MPTSCAQSLILIFSVIQKSHDTVAHCDFSIHGQKLRRSKSSSTIYLVSGLSGVHEILLIQTKQSDKEKVRGRHTQRDCPHPWSKNNLGRKKKLDFLVSKEMGNRQARF